MDTEAGGRGKKGGNKGGGKGGGEDQRSTEEKLKSVMERYAKIKGTPEEAEKKPKLEQREKRLRAKLAEEGAKKA
ncbi:MAG: hypothetical protein ABI056_03895 [Caulobacteraceae bacterium]